MGEKLSRRSFLRLATATAGGFALASRVDLQPVAAASEKVKTTDWGEGILVSENIPLTGVTGTELADGANFKYTLHPAMRAFAADKGGLKIDAAYFLDEKGVFSPEKAAAYLAAKGNIQMERAATAIRTSQSKTADFFAPDGGWAKVHLPKGRIEFDEGTVIVLPETGVQYEFMVRGLYGTPEQHSDKNGDFTITEFGVGKNNNWSHVLMESINASDVGNIAFLSEGQLIQSVADGHRNETNRGRGAHKVKVVYFDLNTHSLAILDHVQDRGTSIEDSRKLAAQKEKYRLATRPDGSDAVNYKYN